MSVFYNKASNFGKKRRKQSCTLNSFLKCQMSTRRTIKKWTWQKVQNQESWWREINITRDCKKDILNLDQKRYIEEILTKFKISDCNSVNIPLENKYILSVIDVEMKRDVSESLEIPYQVVVGSLMYLNQRIRPEIIHILSII